MLKQYLIIFFLILLFVVLCGSIFFLSDTAAKERIWKGFYLIGIPKEETENNINKLLDNFEIVSLYNTIIKYNDYGKIKEITLDKIEDRFVAGDPRIDPYMNGAAEYFSTVDKDSEEYNIIYIRSNKYRISFYLKLRRLLGKEINSWLIPDVNILDYILPAVFFLFYWLFFHLRVKKSGLIHFFLGLPWIFSILLNGAAIFPISITIYFLITSVVKEIEIDIDFFLNYRKITSKKRLKYLLILLSSIFIFITVFNILLNLNVSIIIYTILADIDCLMLYYLLRSKKISRQEHRTFFPVSLNIKKKENNKNEVLLEVSIIVILFLINFMLPFFSSDALNAVYPKPIKSSLAEDWSLEEMKTISKLEKEELINVSDYVSHLVFQEVYMYGREYSLPKEGEKFFVDYFSKTGEIVKKEQRCVFEFTEDWYSNIIQKIHQKGLPLLLLNQDKPLRVIKSATSANTDKHQYSIYIVYFLLLLFFIWQKMKKIEKP